jgi:hypothetical protein
VEDGGLDREYAELGADRRREAVGEGGREPLPERTREERRERRDAEDGGIGEEEADVEEPGGIEGEEEEGREAEDLPGRGGAPEKPGAEIEADHERRAQDGSAAAGEGGERGGGEEDDRVPRGRPRPEGAKRRGEAEREEPDVEAGDREDVGDAAVPKRRDGGRGEAVGFAQEKRPGERGGLPFAGGRSLETVQEPAARGAVEACEGAERSPGAVEELDLRRGFLRQPRLGGEDEGTLRDRADVRQAKRAPEANEVAVARVRSGVRLPRHAHDEATGQLGTRSLPPRLLDVDARGPERPAPRPVRDEPAPDLEDVVFRRGRGRLSRRLPVDDEPGARAGERQEDDEEEAAGGREGSGTPKSRDDGRAGAEREGERQDRGWAGKAARRRGGSPRRRRGPPGPPATAPGATTSASSAPLEPRERLDVVRSGEEVEERQGGDAVAREERGEVPRERRGSQETRKRLFGAIRRSAFRTPGASPRAAVGEDDVAPLPLPMEVLLDAAADRAPPSGEPLALPRREVRDEVRRRGAVGLHRIGLESGLEQRAGQEPAPA